MLPAAYVDAVRDAGGLPVLLAPGETAVEPLLHRLDGLVLTGGGDLDPAYGAAPHPATYFTSPQRDAFEIELVEGAIDRSLPTLAICRGLQILNAARGGTLHAHLPEVVGDAVVHRRDQDAAAAHHVEIDSGSRLARTLGAEVLADVPSWHHQSIHQVGEGLNPVAFAADGIIEAIELVNEGPLLAVQWHPELEPAEGAGRRLFDQLIAWAGSPRAS